MNKQELNQLMVDSANDAVKVSNEEFSIALDYSKDSVQHVDEVLQAYLTKYHDQALEDKAVFTICNIFGAYVGECFKRLAGGQWIYDESNPDAPSIYIVIGENSYAFAGICYQRLVNKTGLSVNEYFMHALSQHQTH